MTRPMPGPPKYDPTAWPHVTGTATREVHYCMEDQQEWPCRTVQAIEEQN